MPSPTIATIALWPAVAPPPSLVLRQRIALRVHDSDRTGNSGSAALDLRQKHRHDAEGFAARRRGRIVADVAQLNSAANPDASPSATTTW
jgi:hypothetical protein